jgi:hypothetical protein
MNALFRRLFAGAGTIACVFILSAVAESQNTPASTKVVDFGKQPPPGRWQPLCPQLAVEAHRSSRKIASETGGVLGSGLTGETPSISKCKGGALVWRQTVNALPSALAEDGIGHVYYAGMTPGKGGMNLGVGELDRDGRPVWSDTIGSPEHEAHAVIALSWGGVYVLAASAGSLPGQPASAAGHRFLVRYERGGKRRWIKQSKDFGKRPIESGGGTDDTPATIAADGVGNVYVLSSLPPNARSAQAKGAARLATLFKFNREGKQLWQKTLSVDLTTVDANSYRATLTDLVVDPEGSSIYVAGDALRNSHSELIVMRLDRRGSPRWTKLVSLAYSERAKTDDGGQYSESGDTDWVRGIGVSAETLLVVSAYENSYIETASEEEAELGIMMRDSSHSAAVAAFDSVDGELQWARLYSGLGPQYGSATEFQPSGLQTLRSGAFVVTGHDDLYVAQSNQRFEDVPSTFLLMDAKAGGYEIDPLNAAELEFFRGIQRAVAAGDKQWMADNVGYPLEVGSGEIIKTKAEFLKRYDSIVTDAVRKAVAEQEGPWVRKKEGHLMVSDGELGFNEFINFVNPNQAPKQWIAIISIYGGPPVAQPAAAAPLDTAPPVAAAQPATPEQTNAAPAVTPEPQTQKSAKELRREKMKKFFEDLDKKTQKK